MAENKITFDSLKETFEKGNPELKVISILDLNKTTIVINCERRDGQPMVPGASYTISKKTGEIEGLYSPMKDFDEFSKALKSGCKVFD